MTNIEIKNILQEKSLGLCSVVGEMPAAKIDYNFNEVQISTFFSLDQDCVMLSLTSYRPYQSITVSSPSASVSITVEAGVIHLVSDTFDITIEKEAE